MSAIALEVVEKAIQGYFKTQESTDGQGTLSEQQVADLVKEEIDIHLRGKNNIIIHRILNCDDRSDLEQVLDILKIPNPTIQKENIKSCERLGQATRKTRPILIE